MNSELLALYEKYKITTASLFDEGSPFSLLLAQIEAGHNGYSHFSRKIKKIIDLKWVDAIENCIVPLDTIIRNPRRFIVQEEEIVPIEKAKKISAESIRHLAQHTNMINSVTRDGRVTPNRILNVFREESFDIYENRFIYTLLINVKNFIEKRYAVILGLAGDENVDAIDMKGSTTFGKEEVNYTLHIDAKRASANDDDASDTEVLARVERIRRIIGDFLSSPFAAELAGCALVRPPITRTNLIMKDPNFKQCLDLWIFVESYDKVGYELNVIENDEPVDEDYIKELNRLMAFNYMMLKSHVKDKGFMMDDLRGNRRKLKPKFIKSFIEEIVDNYDVTDDEVRRIFIEQIDKHTTRRKAEERSIDRAVMRCLDVERVRKAAIALKLREEARLRAEAEKKKKEKAAAKSGKSGSKTAASGKASAAESAAALERERKQREKAKAKEKEKAALQRAMALERERKQKAKAKEKEKAAKEKARLKAKADAAKARAGAKAGTKKSPAKKPPSKKSAPDTPHGE